ncbi:MAG: two-component system activity regulator YycH [Dethiobacteria bacterium]|nr:hypothetical protein [Bacillota bacterium]
MFERLKTIVLALLVVSSLVLTQRLWFGSNIYELGGEPGYEQFDVDSPRSPQEAVIPEKTIINRDQETYYLLGRGDRQANMLWEEVLEFLQANFSMLLTRQFPLQELADDFSLYFSFSPPVVLEEKDEHLPSFNLSELWVFDGEDSKEFVFLTDHGESFIFEYQLAEGERLPGLQLLAQERLIAYERITDTSSIDVEGSTNPEDEGTDENPEGFEENQEGLNSEENSDAVINQEHRYSFNLREGLFVPFSSFSLPSYTLVKEDLDFEMLLGKLFLDQTLMRRIEERDGTIIYTDGEKGLSVFKDGMIAYFAPRTERGPTTMGYKSALQKAAEHISLLGGWTDTAELDILELRRKDIPYQREQHYYAHWRVYLNGYPLLGDYEVEMFFNDRGLGSYRRKLLIPEEQLTEKQVISYAEAIKTALEQYFVEGEGNFGDETEKEITALSLAYFCQENSSEPIAIPVWVVELDGREHIINAYSGDVLSLNQ